MLKSLAWAAISEVMKGSPQIADRVTRHRYLRAEHKRENGRGDVIRSRFLHMAEITGRLEK